mgnify:CR=1 FL=1
MSKENRFDVIRKAEHMKIIKKMLFYHRIKCWDRMFYRMNGKDCFVPPPSRYVQFFIDDRKHPDEDKLEHKLRVYGEIQNAWNDKRKKDKKQLELMIDSLEDYDRGWRLADELKGLSGR